MLYFTQNFHCFRIRNCLTQLNAKDITPDDKQELDEALQREVIICLDYIVETNQQIYNIMAYCTSFPFPCSLAASICALDNKLLPKKAVSRKAKHQAQLMLLEYLICCFSFFIMPFFYPLLYPNGVIFSNL